MRHTLLLPHSLLCILSESCPFLVRRQKDTLKLNFNIFSSLPLLRHHKHNCIFRSLLLTYLSLLAFLLPTWASSEGLSQHPQLSPRPINHVLFSVFLIFWHLRFRYIHICCCCLVTKSCPALLWPPLDCSLPDSSFHGIFQARILEYVAISFSRGFSWPRDQTHISCIGRQILYYWATREALIYFRVCLT